MASRGGRRGGRSWGRGGGRNFSVAKPFVLFPETELPDTKAVKEEKQLVSMSLKWENFWKSSAYYLEEKTINGGQTNSAEIERFSDKNKKKTASQRDSMYQILQLTSSNFPRVLIAGSKESRSRKRVRWNPLKDLERLEALEKKDGDQTSEKKKKEGDEDDSEKEDEDDEDKPKEGEEEFSDDGDYNQNVDFDDDEDDFNMADGGDDEPEF